MAILTKSGTAFKVTHKKMSDSFANLFRVLQVNGNYPQIHNLQEVYLYLKRLLEP